MKKKQHIKNFTKKVWNYYKVHGRDLPWRKTVDPYRIWVSEIMLQQTQVGRVIPKYTLFLKKFPSVNKLAIAPLREVLEVWSGLGYNRRAKSLHTVAGKIMLENKGRFPKIQTEWAMLPGIGMNTAGAIMVYAYNEPVSFIETNIRSVYIAEFFSNFQDVSDSQIMLLVEQTIDRHNPREWYWALMDYGSMLKKTMGNANRQSRNYTKQSTFKGSHRQLRGAVIRCLITLPTTVPMLSKRINEPEAKVAAVVAELVAEQFITQRGRILAIR